LALYEDPSEGASVSGTLLKKPTNQSSNPYLSGMDPDPLFTYSDTDPDLRFTDPDPWCITKDLKKFQKKVK
jgi:hypothetical protein